MRVKELYPAAGSTEEIASYNSSYTRAGLVYRDVVLTCPTYWVANSAHERSFVGEYAISPAKHASDTIYVRFPSCFEFASGNLKAPELIEIVESSQRRSKDTASHI